MKSFANIICAAMLTAGAAQAEPVMLGYDWSFEPAPRFLTWTVCAAGFSADEIEAIEAGIAVWTEPVAMSITLDSDPACSANTGFNACTATRIIDKGAFVAGAPELETNRLAAAFVCNEPGAPTRMKGCDIRVFTEPRFFTGAGTPPAGMYHLRSVIAHEFGHCMGFNDQKTDKSELMFGKFAPQEVRMRKSAAEQARFDAIYK